MSTNVKELSMKTNIGKMIYSLMTWEFAEEVIYFHYHDPRPYTL